MADLWIVDLGLMDYMQALDIQHRLVAAKKAGAIETDILFLLEHPAVITLGRRGNPENVRATPETLARLGIPVYTVERAGDVTYHGPGQLVGYPVLDLGHFRKDVGWFVQTMQLAVQNVLKEYGIETYPLKGHHAGLWIKGGAMPALQGDWDPATRAALAQAFTAQSERKIMAQGARIEEWISFHGFALNVNTNLTHFDLIVPCGITDKGVTSMARELGHPISLAHIKSQVGHQFQHLFDQQAQLRSLTDVDTLLGAAPSKV